MTRSYFLSFLLCSSVMSFIGCDSLPGKPTLEDRWVASNEIMDFKTLYGQNCAACHGQDGLHGAALSLNDPLFLAIVNKEVLTDTISKGVSGTSMPAFSLSSGGTLTNKQIESLVNGMMSNWGQPGQFNGVTLPPYSIQTATADGSGPGDVARGAAAFNTFCAQCHGNDGKGGKAGSVVNADYLGLVSDQGLRTIVIVGRPDLGKPDWRKNISGQPMTAQEISDVVAWLASHRSTAAGRQGGNP